MANARFKSKSELLRGMRRAERVLNEAAQLLHRGNLTTAQKIKVRKAKEFANAVISAMSLLKTRRA